jgi:hypothetical protein
MQYKCVLETTEYKTWRRVDHYSDNVPSTPTRIQRKEEFTFHLEDKDVKHCEFSSEKIKMQMSVWLYGPESRMVAL